MQNDLEHRVYRGSIAIHQNGAMDYIVEVDDYGMPYHQDNPLLDPRYDLRNHSPDGFAWGYGGSGPSQLALAILADVMGDEFAQQHYQQFKFQVIARLDKDNGFVLSAMYVKAWAEALVSALKVAKMADWEDHDCHKSPEDGCDCQK